MGKTRLGIVAVLVGMGMTGVVCGPTGAAPKPALVPPANTWQLDFELHGDPQQISVTLPGDNAPRRFWYLLYTVRNDAGQDVEFHPQFDLLTDTFLAYRGGVKPSRAVFEKIRRRYRKTIPLLEREDSVTGRLLQGEDNARDGVALIEDFDPNAVRVKVFVTGLSNENVLVEVPTVTDPATGRPKQALLRKTLMLEYAVPGDRYNPEKRIMLYRNRKWVMR